MIQISMKFDGGIQQYNRALETLGKKIKNYRTLWQALIAYFEGQDIGLQKMPQQKSPIVEIWESEGRLIGGRWKNSSSYEIWKDKNWRLYREYNVPISRKAIHILSGQTLSALLDDKTPGAIRTLGMKTLVYGVSNDYVDDLQTKRRILDFFPAMFRTMDRILAKWIVTISPEYLEVKE